LLFALLVVVTQSANGQSSTDKSHTYGRSDQDARIHRIEETAVDVSIAGDEAPIRLNLARLMQQLNVPGLSVAVIDNFEIVWAKGYGVIESGSTARVSTQTLFQAGSISKPVAATGALYLVEHGKLSLDEDLNQKLVSWKIPENEFTKDSKVTLRRIMSHTAGLTIHGFPGYDIDAPIPTLVQIFNGEKPANTAPIRVDTVPGTKARYSGGGTTIEQQVMIDVTGKSFPTLMNDIVLAKVGMTDSSYEQPLPPARAAVTAHGTYVDGKTVHGSWHIYPEMAAAGLWTTPTDLSKFVIEIARSKHGKSNRILSERMTREMLTPVMEEPAIGLETGLGFFLEKDNPGQFGHNGGDEGFQALLTMNSESGQGAAIMANSDNGILIESLLLQRIVKEYGWHYRSDASNTLSLIAKLKGVDAALAWYSELKRTAPAEYRVNQSTLNSLGQTLEFQGQTQDAITVFRRNAQDYPNSADAYDSLAGAYMKAGQSELAIQNYELSLKLDPKNQHAVDMLSKLKQKQ
jgi:CubicO group peptidase (beta-lactamase class C family)